MEDEEFVKIFNPTLKRREAILFFLIVVINGLKCIVSDIGLDTCARGSWRVEVSKLEINLTLSKLLQYIIHKKKLVSYYYSKARSAPISEKWNSTIIKVALHSYIHYLKIKSPT